MMKKIILKKLYGYGTYFALLNTLQTSVVTVYPICMQANKMTVIYVAFKYNVIRMLITIT